MNPVALHAAGGVAGLKVVLVSATRVAISPDIINCAKYLAGAGARVWVLAAEDAPLPEYWFPETGVVSVKYRLRTGGGAWINRFRRIGGFALWAAREVQSIQPDLLIGYDPDGLSAASFAARMLGGRPVVYQSLELYTCDKGSGLGQRIKKGVEVALNQGASGTIVHDARREIVLRASNRLGRSAPVVTLANVPLAAGSFARESRRAAGGVVPRTVLYHGGLGPLNMVEEMIQAVPSWPAHWELLLHGWGPSDYIERLRRMAEDLAPGRIRLSTTFLKYEDLDTLTAGADVGVALYRNTGSPNVFEMASGKIFQYLKCGLPVVTVDFPNLRALVADHGAGFVVPTGLGGELTAALHALLDDPENFERYSKRARARFLDELCYEKNGPALLALVAAAGVRIAI